MIAKRLKLASLGVGAILVLTAGQCPHEPGVENEKDVGETSADIATKDIIVFTRRSRVEPNYDLWRMNSNRSGQRRISSTPDVNEQQPKMSPDGTKVAYMAKGDIFLMNLDGSGVVNLTGAAQFDAAELTPAWSPDGNFIYFAGSSDNDYDIYRVPSAGSAPRASGGADPDRIVDASGNQFAPDVSPDGAQVIYVTHSSAEHSDIGSAPAIGGGTPSIVHQCPINKCQVFFPRWSHDGTRIAFWSFRGVDDSGLYILQVGGEAEYQRVQGGLDVHPLAWSPTDAEIAYIEDGDNNISARSTTSLTERDLVTCQCRFHDGLDWAEVEPLITIKDASRTEGHTSTSNMRFVVQLSGRADVAVSVTATTEGRTGEATSGVDFDATAGTVTIPPGQTEEYFNVPIRGDTQFEPNERFHVLLSNPQNGELGRRKAYGKILDDDKPPPPSPSPSPSGSPSPTGPGAIAYQTNGEVWVMKPDGTDQHKLTDGAAPDWKHDGTQIAFFDQASADPDIFQIPPTGGTPTRVNGTSSFDGSPSWAPDGSGISWTNLGAGAPDIYKAEPPTGTPTPVVATAASEFNQDWDVIHDGTEVMAIVRDSAIILVNPDTGAQIGPELVPAAHLANNPAISPDGTKLAYNSNEHGDPDIFVKDLTNLGAPVAHLTTSSAEDVAPTWSPDGTMLAFQTNRDGNFEIYTMNAATGAGQTNITNTPANEVEAAWGPAGTAAVISAVSDALDEPSTDDEEPSSVVPSRDGRPSPSSSGTERGVRIAIPGLLLSSWLLGRRRKDRHH